LVKKGNISPPGAGKICFMIKLINPYTGETGINFLAYFMPKFREEARI
jgi:hypothetical protein